jgi:hypothetical protein
VTDKLPTDLNPHILLLPEQLVSEAEIQALRLREAQRLQVVKEDPPSVGKPDAVYDQPRQSKPAAKKKVETSGGSSRVTSPMSSPSHQHPERMQAAQHRLHTEGTNPYFVGQQVQVRFPREAWINAEVVEVHSPFVDQQGKDLGDAVVTRDLEGDKVGKPDNRRIHFLDDGKIEIMPMEGWPEELLPAGWTTRLEESDERGVRPKRVAFADRLADGKKQYTPPVKADWEVLRNYVPDQQDALHGAIAVSASELVKMTEGHKDSSWCVVVVLDSGTMLQTNRVGFIPKAILRGIETDLHPPVYTDGHSPYRLDRQLYDIIGPEVFGTSGEEVVGRPQTRSVPKTKRLAESAYYATADHYVISKEFEVFNKLSDKLQKAISNFKARKSRRSLEALAQAHRDFAGTASKYDRLAQEARRLLDAQAEEDKERMKAALIDKLKKATTVAAISSAMAAAEKEMPDDKEFQQAVEEKRRELPKLLKQGPDKLEVAARAKLQEAFEKKNVKAIKKTLLELKVFLPRGDGFLSMAEEKLKEMERLPLKGPELMESLDRAQRDLEDFAFMDEAGARPLQPPPPPPKNVFYRADSSEVQHAKDDVRIVLHEYHPPQVEDGSHYASPNQDFSGQDDGVAQLRCGDTVRVVKRLDAGWVEVMQVNADTLEPIYHDPAEFGKFPESLLSAKGVTNPKYATNNERVVQRPMHSTNHPKEEEFYSSVESESNLDFQTEVSEPGGQRGRKMPIIPKSSSLDSGTPRNEHYHRPAPTRHGIGDSGHHGK